MWKHRGFFMPTNRQMENFRAKILEQDLGNLQDVFARSNSTQGSPVPGHQPPSKAPGHHLIQGQEFLGFRRGTKELILIVTPRPTQFSPRFCNQRETEALLALHSFPQISPFPAPTTSGRYLANDQYFTPACRTAFCWVLMAHQPSSSSICAGERRN